MACNAEHSISENFEPADIEAVEEPPATELQAETNNNLEDELEGESTASSRYICHPEPSYLLIITIGIAQ
eukprot:4760623-Pyramimonas_sp.AAC.1